MARRASYPPNLTAWPAVTRGGGGGVWLGTLTPLPHTPTSDSYLHSRGRRAREDGTTWGHLPRAPHGWRRIQSRGQGLLPDLCQVTESWGLSLYVRFSALSENLLKTLGNGPGRAALPLEQRQEAVTCSRGSWC